MTLPYRVAHRTVASGSQTRDFAIMTFSIIAFDIPIALIGYTALSVLSTTQRRTSLAMAARITFSAPTTLVWTASIGWNSHDGTCLSAAA